MGFKELTEKFGLDVQKSLDEEKKLGGKPVKKWLGLKLEYRDFEEERFSRLIDYSADVQTLAKESRKEKEIQQLLEPYEKGWKPIVHCLIGISTH